MSRCRGAGPYAGGDILGSGGGISGAKSPKKAAELPKIIPYLYNITFLPKLQ